MTKIPDGTQLWYSTKIIEYFGVKLLDGRGLSFGKANLLAQTLLSVENQLQELDGNGLLEIFKAIEDILDNGDRSLHKGHLSHVQRQQILESVANTLYNTQIIHDQQ